MRRRTMSENFIGSLDRVFQEEAGGLRSNSNHGGLARLIVANLRRSWARTVGQSVAPRWLQEFFIPGHEIVRACDGCNHRCRGRSFLY